MLILLPRIIIHLAATPRAKPSRLATNQLTTPIAELPRRNIFAVVAHKLKTNNVDGHYE
jgi:hypothetical protein